ncbi:hypothetical protein KI387_008073, partial [Taxus chinensis]
CSEIPSQNNQFIDIDDLIYVEENILSLDETEVQENSSNSQETPAEEASTPRSISRKRRHEIQNIPAEKPDAEVESHGKKRKYVRRKMANWTIG